MVEHPAVNRVVVGSSPTRGGALLQDMHNTPQRQVVHFRWWRCPISAALLEILAGLHFAPNPSGPLRPRFRAAPRRISSIPPGTVPSWACRGAPVVGSPAARCAPESSMSKCWHALRLLCPSTSARRSIDYLPHLECSWGHAPPTAVKRLRGLMFGELSVVANTPGIDGPTQDFGPAVVVSPVTALSSNVAV